ncbi:MAG: Druantia anti-phage system protein DruA [Limisphaerales bacterium]
MQGRNFSRNELVELQVLIDKHPHWSRHGVAKELCQRWDWRTPSGRLKTFAARSLLLKLAQRRELRLPPVREAMRRSPWGLGRPQEWPAAPVATALETSLESLQPLEWQIGGHGSRQRERALAYLRQYHYLGCNRPVGAHLLYLVKDVLQRDVAVHLVGAAAWQCAPRDHYIGWSGAQRAAGLHRIGNHSRFLILPWVRVPHLASHLLGGLARRLCADWPAHHGWRLELLETFVEADRFRGVAYRAANWQQVGLTTGRTRQEKQHRPKAPRKSVWVYPLGKRFRENLGALGGCGGAQ